MSQPLTQMVYEGIPPLPDNPDAGLPPPQPMNMPQRGGNAPANGIPKFELVPVRLKNGAYVNREYVTILTPGDPKAMPRHKVDNLIRQKYRSYYDLWRQGLEASPIGTPLEMYPMLNPALIMGLKAANIFTVEQLANMADNLDHQIPMAQTLKQNARKWLALKKDADTLSRQDQENAALKAQMKMMSDQLASQNAVLESLKAAEEDRKTPKKRGRPKNVDSDNEPT